MPVLRDIVLGILNIIITVVAGLVLIAVLAWVLEIIGFGLPADVEGGLRALVFLIALVQGVSLVFGAPRWYFR